MRYFFTPSLLAAVVVADHTSNKATAMSVKESLLRKDVCGSGPAGTAAPGGRLVTRRRRCDSETKR